MKVSVKMVGLNKVIRDLNRTSQSLNGLHDRIEQAVQIGADEILADRSYENRTGNLERNTKVFIERGPDAIYAMFGAFTDYARPVRALGYMPTDDAETKARNAIADVIRYVRKSFEKI